jgi:hypothetical protein
MIEFLAYFLARALFFLYSLIAEKTITRARAIKRNCMSERESLEAVH